MPADRCHGTWPLLGYTAAGCPCGDHDVSVEKSWRYAYTEQVGNQARNGGTALEGESVKRLAGAMNRPCVVSQEIMEFSESLGMVQERFRPR